MLITNNGAQSITMNLRDGRSYVLTPGVPVRVPDAATTMIDDSAYLIGLFNAGTLTVTTDAGGAFAGFPTTVNAADSAAGKALHTRALVGSDGTRTLIDETGAPITTGGSGSVAVQALSADRALSASDHRANLAMTANRSVTVGEGGIEPHFINSSNAPLTLTITGTNGVVVNGRANGSVTRVIPSRGTLTMRVDAAGSYDVPEPALTVIEQPAKLFAWEEDGSVVQRFMPRAERILAAGSCLFSPTALGSTAARSVELYSGARSLIQSETNTATGVLITILTAGYVSTGWSGLSIPTTTNGLLQAMVWVDNFDAGQPFTSNGNIQITLTNAGGTITYTFAAGGFKPGWNTLQLWNPAGAANPICEVSGVSTVASNTGFTFGSPATSVGLIINNAALNAKIQFAGIWSQTRVKPMVMMTFDVSNANVFSNFLPAWDAAGLKTVLRCGGADSYRSNTWLAPLLTAYNNGHDVYNGSWSRAGLTDATTAEALAREANLQHAYNARRGFTRGRELFSTAGNSGASTTTSRNVFGKLGIRVAKYGTTHHRFAVFGPAGTDEPLRTPTRSYPGLTAALAEIEAIKATGGLLMWFAHDAPTGQTAAAVPTGNGGGIWAEEVPALASALANEVAAGNIDVVTASQYVRILDGMA